MQMIFLCLIPLYNKINMITVIFKTVNVKTNVFQRKMAAYVNVISVYNFNQTRVVVVMCFFRISLWSLIIPMEELCRFVFRLEML